MTIYLPSRGPDAWQALLADPHGQWQTGFSARTIAHCWGEAAGLPPEIDAILGGGTDLLLALPEHKVPLPGGQRASQCDVFALARQHGQCVAIAVEGKVNEPFGPTIGTWLREASTGKQERLSAIARLLGKSQPIPQELHYQLFHRSAAAIIEAQRFKTDAAAMIVHSFSPENRWFQAFAEFCSFLGSPVASPDTLATLALPDGSPLHLGWARGDPKFLLA